MSPEEESILPPETKTTSGNFSAEERHTWRQFGGSKRDAGSVMEKNDNEANGAQDEVTLQSLMETLISMN